MTDQAISRVDKFLAGATKKPSSRGNLIFALDATASREKTWDTAAHLQVQMFHEVAVIGSLDLQLVYFRGTAGTNAECKASAWVNDPANLATLMARIKCQAGLTQISRVLSHTLRESDQRKINATVFVGDACEDNRNQLVESARELGNLGIPVFMFQEGRDQIARLRFQEIAELTHGAYHRFDQGSAKQLAELLRAVAAFAVGGVVALERQRSDASQYLLGQIKQ
jgi:hypothetical protein